MLDVSGIVKRERQKRLKDFLRPAAGAAAPVDKRVPLKLS